MDPKSPQDDEILRRGAPLGRYIIIEVLGSGGMGIVYAAFDPELDRKVACKVLRKKWDSAARLRLRREAKAMAKLSHSNVVRVYEVVTEGEHDFVVMEFVEGQDVESWSREDHTAREILGVYVQAGEGLWAAHRAGLVHRDFKPQNILIDKHGHVLVTDFGLARQDSMIAAEIERLPSQARSPSASALNLTETGIVMGTPAYMAPEQHLAEAVDARSDQFGFCVSLFEALSNRRPYSGETYFQLREQVTTQVARALPDSVEVSQAVRDALARGLSRNPGDRFETMEGLLESLGERKSRSKARSLGLLLGALLLVAATATLVFLWSGRSEAVEECQPDREILAGRWDPEARAKLSKAFADTGVSGASDAFSAFSRRLDEYAETLVDFRRDICEARRGPERIADEVMVLQVSCLQKRLQALASLCSRFSDVDPTSLWRAVDAALSLESVSTCSDVEALMQGVEAPRPELRAVVGSLQSQLRNARELLEADARRKALAEVQDVLSQSMTIDYKPLRAEAHFVEGLVLVGLERTAEAREALEEAVLAAEECDHREIRAKALVALTSLLRKNSSGVEEANVYARRARAAIDLIGGSDQLDIKLLSSLASAKSGEGKPEEALALLTTALQQVESRGTRDLFVLAQLWREIAELQIALGMFEDANRTAKKMHEKLLKVLGATHPRRFFALEVLARTHRMIGEYETAHSYSELVHEFWQSENGENLIRGHEWYQEKYRDASGLVVGPHGDSVEGAAVVCGPSIFAGARFIDSVWSGHFEALGRLRVTKSDRDGRFTCRHTTRGALVIGAEHPDFGRSQPVRAEASDENVVGLKLGLAATGSLEGRVVVHTKPKAAQLVAIVPAGNVMVDPDYAAGAVLRGDSFHFDGLLPGSYRVSVSGYSRTADANLRAKEVVISAGETTVVTLDEKLGSAAVRFTAKGAHGTFVKSVQLMVIAGHHDLRSGKSFGEQIYAKGGNYRSTFLADGESTEIDGLVAGPYTICLVPVDGDYRDAEFVNSMTDKERDELVFHCNQLTLAANETYVHKVKVPALEND